MKIVSWNCNGAFRKKYDFLLNIDWDVAIIQECENPESINDAKYHSLFKEKIWIGTNKNKGVGIFTREKKIEIDLRYSNLSTEFCKYGDSSHELKYFLPVKIDDYIIIGTWCHTGDDYIFRYIGQLWKYLLLNDVNIDTKTLFIGDFNANKIWDYEHGWWNFSTVNRMLNDKNLYSFYHHLSKENFGKEKEATFYLHRNKDKPYHIDYAYGSLENYLDIKILNIPKSKEVELSDHKPLYIEVL